MPRGHLFHWFPRRGSRSDHSPVSTVVNRSIGTVHPGQPGERGDPPVLGGLWFGSSRRASGPSQDFEPGPCFPFNREPQPAFHPPSASGNTRVVSARSTLRILRWLSKAPTRLARRSHSSNVTRRITCLTRGIWDGTSDKDLRPKPIRSIVYVISPAISPQRLVSTPRRLAALMTFFTSLITAGFEAE